ncbi:MAG: formate/nitrite transporter family protein [Lachnospiraceae bacterium]|nr:formate/nitrite transporter family protein [Lachnospiraceae bacterium]
MKMKELWIQSILAGSCIGIGGALFLAIDNKVIGALFFTLGLFTICTRGFHLFTGRIGYVFENPPAYSASLIITWLGNLIGTNLVALALTFTRNAAAFQEKAQGMCDVKLNDSLLSVFVLGIFCNILMYIAVDGFRTNKHEIGKYIGLFLCVAGFILAGFEHCIANMFYFGMANMWSFHTIIWLLGMTAGNIVGGILIPLCKRFIA